MRLLLVNPTIVDKPEHLHLGLGTVATYVAQNSAHEVRVLDFVTSRRRWRERLAEALSEVRPDLIGLYVASPYLPAARRVADAIKSLVTDTPVVAGGHHPTLAPEEVMAHAAFDFVLVGEGEVPMLQLLDVLENGGALESVPGLWWRENGTLRHTEKAPLLPASRIPAVDWSVHDEETLRQVFYLWGILPVMASRGCPSSCSFCSITQLQRLYPGEKFLRFREPAEVVDEIEAQFERYRSMGLRIVFFYDLNFLLRPDWLAAFTDEYRRRGLNRTIPWSAYTRADHVTPTVLESLRDSGCVNLRVGVEAANPFMRNEVYDKRISQERLREALAAIKQLGISTTGYFMAGGPGERPEWLLESMDFARREGIEYPVFFLYKHLAGTEALERARGLGSELVEHASDESADFLHGVSLRHRHLRAWQLRWFLSLTHLAFGPMLLVRQWLRAPLLYPVRLLRYLARALRLGFPIYAAFTYFVFYGYDHLTRPIRLRAGRRVTPGWWLVRRLTGALLGTSEQAEPARDASTAPASLLARKTVAETEARQ